MKVLFSLFLSFCFLINSSFSFAASRDLKRSKENLNPTLEMAFKRLDLEEVQKLLSKRADPCAINEAGVPIIFSLFHVFENETVNKFLDQKTREELEKKASHLLWTLFESTSLEEQTILLTAQKNGESFFSTICNLDVLSIFKIVIPYLKKNNIALAAVFNGISPSFYFLEKTKGAIRIEALKFWLRDNAEALDEKNDAGISFLERAVHVLSPKDFRTLFPNL